MTPRSEPPRNGGCRVVLLLVNLTLSLHRVAAVSSSWSEKLIVEDWGLYRTTPFAIWRASREMSRCRSPSRTRRTPFCADATNCPWRFQVIISDSPRGSICISNSTCFTACVELEESTTPSSAKVRTRRNQATQKQMTKAQRIMATTTQARYQPPDLHSFHLQRAARCRCNAAHRFRYVGRLALWPPFAVRLSTSPK